MRSKRGKTGLSPEGRTTRALLQAAISAVVLVILAIYLWGLHGIRTVDMQNMPKPVQYWNTTLTVQDQLTQQFSSDDPSMRGVEVYPLFSGEDLAEESASLHLTLWDCAEPETPLNQSVVSFESLTSAEWNYVPLRARLEENHVYQLTYTVSGVADTGIGLVLYPAEEQSAFAPYLHCEDAFQNGEDLGGCVLQNILIQVPVSGLTNLALFLSVLIILAVIFAVGNREWIGGHMPGKLLFPVDRELQRILGRYFPQFGFACLLVLSAYLRWSLVPFVSGDLVSFLEPWVSYYRQVGIADGLMNMRGDYYVPYNLLLALTSRLPGSVARWLALYACIADYIIAIFGGKICTLLLTRNSASHAMEKGWMTTCLLLFLPPVFLDSAAWKQADTIYICFLVVMLYELLRGQYAWAFLFWGISLSFKLQAVFLLPVLIILYLYRKCRLWHFLIPPVVFVAAGMPAVLAGADPAFIYGRYVQQTKEPVLISVLFPNFYYLGLYNDALRTAGILCAAAAFVFSAVYLKQRYSTFHDSMLLYYAVWSAWTCVMFLPSMHQRYDIAVAILLVILCAGINHAMIPFLLVSALCSTITMGNYLFLPDDRIVPLLPTAAVYCSAYLGYTMYLLLKGRKLGEN